MSGYDLTSRKSLPVHVPAGPPPAGVWSLSGAQVKHALGSDAALHVAHVTSQLAVRESSRYWQLQLHQPLKIYQASGYLQ